MSDSAAPVPVSASPLGALLELPQTDALLSLDLDEFERVMAKVALAENGCWLWTATCNPGGYGNVFFRGRNRLAHHVTYELFVGPRPGELVLDHLCRNTRCVNPAHLEAVTHRINVRRGVGACAENARKTHCPQGHRYDKVVARGSGYARICTRCQREHSRKWVARKRAVERAARRAAV